MTAGAARHGDIAIIGMACRFPGANDWRSFWRNLVDGVESIAEFGEAELLGAGIDPALLRDPAYVRAAPVIDGHDCFDAGLFEYSPREARLIDPQHRIFLEVAWEALEDAGHRPDAAEQVVGVFAGAGGLVSSYFAAHPDLRGATGDVAHLGNDKDFIATRVSYKLDLTGPSVTVQTACSTGLVAVHLACGSIRNGECDMAIAGAAAVRVPHVSGYLARQGDILSPDGHCRAFDAAAQGTVFGSGAGAVILKSLGDALADGDHIYAVIRGTAVNNDGARKVSYTASSVDGQAAAILEALDRAGVSPRRVGYVEAHGTGTAVGDPLEIEALTRAFRSDTGDRGFCAIGSVKTNIGHLEQAAGLAGLIKTALCLYHRRLPPTLNFTTPNPKIRFAESPFVVAAALGDWPADDVPRIAGVNALGLGGTNAFAVLEEAPVAVQPSRRVDRPLHVLTLSARTEASLSSLAERWRRFLSETDADLGDLCHTANIGRVALGLRLAAVGRTAEEIAGQLTAAAARPTRRTAGRRSLAFLFTGQGSQRPGMAAGLFRTQPVFRAALERCAEVARPHLDRPLLDLLLDPTLAEGEIHRTEYAQPALFAYGWALAELWRSWGIRPDAVIGHSLGEYLATCVAGVFDLEDALAFVAERGRLMQSLPAGGAMAAVFAEPAVVGDLLRPEDRSLLAVAACNGPQNTVVSGDAAALDAFLARAGRAGVQGRRLAVSHAFHSPLMEPALDRLQALAARCPSRAPTLPLVGNLTGAVVEAAPTAAYWRDHARQPVRFVDGVRTLAALGVVDFLEVGAGSILAPLARQILGRAEAAGRRFLISAAGERDWSELAASLATLWRDGHPVDWQAFDRPYHRRRVSAPTYVFDHERYWLDGGTAVPPAAAGSELPGRRVPSPLPAWQFEAVSDLQVQTWLADHRIFGLAVLPATVGLVALIEAGRQRLGGVPAAITGLTYHDALVVPEDGARVVQTVLSDSGSAVDAELTSRDRRDGQTWQRHMSGRIERLRQPVLADRGEPAAAALDVAGLRRLTAADYYQVLDRSGLVYGPSFRAIVELWRGDGRAVSRVRLPAHLPADGNRLHPAFLDACLHLFPAVVPAWGDFTTDLAHPDGLYLPISFERVEIYRTGVTQAWVTADRRAAVAEDPAVTVDIGVFAEDGTAVAAIVGLTLRPVTRDRLASSPSTSLYAALHRVDWVERPAPRDIPLPADLPSAWLVVGEADGLGAALVAALRCHGRRVAHLPAAAWSTSAEAAAALQAVPVWDDGAVGILLVLPAAVRLAEGMSAADLAAAERGCCGTLLALIQALAVEAESGRRSRLWMVTADGQPEPGGTAGGDPLQAAARGLGRVIAEEHPEIWGGMIDIASDVPADAILGELLAGDGEDQVVLREGRRWVPRLVRERLPASGGGAVAIDPAASYLITGGTGALGLEVAEWLVERQGARCLVLTARRPPDAAAAATIAGLEARGARILLRTADIGQPDDVAALFAAVAAELPPLKGVFHCAGVLDDGILLQMDWQRYARVTAPKAIGGWLLHCATRDLAIDHFVLFSSVLGVTGSMGQANYVAGNAFLDGLAEYRRRRGLPAQTICWGPWAETGLATASGKRGEAIWQSRGTRYIAAAEGIDLLQAVMVHRLPHAVVSLSEWSQWAQQSPRPLRLLEVLSREAPPRAAVPALSREQAAARLAAAPEDERPAVARDMLAELVRGLLGIEEEIGAAEPLRALGLDSLMAINLVNQLDTAFAVRLPVATLLGDATIEQLAAELWRRIPAAASDREAHHAV